MNGWTKRARWLLAAVILGALCLVAACGDSNAEFCELAATSTQGRTEAEINAYYEQLEALAPAEIKDDVTTLRNGWKQFSFPLGGGQASRPPEVSEAARKVFAFVGEVCGTEGGVYLVMPEIGF